MIGSISTNQYKTWLEGEVSHIDIRGIAGEHVLNVNPEPLPIISLYAELDVEEKLPHLPPDKGISKQDRHEQLFDVAFSAKYLTIHGDPGSGKTTFLRYFATKLLSYEKASLLPFYIRLNDVYDYFKILIAKSTTKELTPDALLLFLSEQSENYGWNLTYTQLEKLAKEEHCVWLFDGLDELPSYDERVRMVEFITKLTGVWKKNSFIVTSRPLALVGAVPKGFEVVGIAPLRNEEIKKFLTNWTNLIMKDKSTKEKNSYLSDLESSIGGIEFEQIRELARNPVMLTSMAVIHHNQKHLPESKADLLESMIKWLIRSRDRASTLSNIAEKAFSKLALAMFQHPEGRKTRVGLNWAANKLENLFGNNEQALNFLLNEREGGVIIPRGKGDVEFWHPLFGEYLAAKEIASKLDDDKESGWWSVIKANLDKLEWKEVISLVPSCLLRLGTDRVDVFFERLRKSCLDSDPVTKTRRVGLGGSILKDLHIYGYNIPKVSEWIVLLNEIRPLVEGNANSLTLLERYNAALAFGQLGDPRISKFDDTWVKLPEGEFKMGAQYVDPNSSNYDADATEWEAPVVSITIKPFEIRKYPITVQEFSYFVESGCYENKGQRYWPEEGWTWRVENNINMPDRWQKQLLFPNCPVAGISWYEANAYCKWLTNSMNSQGFVYRLPSEYEWEYAVRRTNPNLKFPCGNVLNKGDDAEVNWVGAGLGKVTPVGMFAASNTKDGIADMIGNVEELCAEEWSWNGLGRKEITKGKEEKYPNKRVVRGGSAIRVSRLCRSTYRSSVLPTSRYPTVGFRCVRQPK